MKRTMLISPLLLCSLLFAQTYNCTLVGRWAHGGSMAVAVDGNRLYYGDGGFLRIADITDPANPEPLGEWLSHGPVYSVVVQGSYAYVSNGSAGLRILDISDVSAPVEISAADVNYKATDAVLIGDYACIADQNYGLHVLNITDPENLPETVFLPLTDAMTIAGTGNYVYMAAEHHGVLVIDITDPDAPVKVDSIDITYVYDVDVGNDMLFAAASESLFIYSLADPGHPVLIETIGEYGFKNSVFYENGIAWVTDAYEGLLGFDVTDPAAPVQLFRFNLGYEGTYTSVTSGNTAFAAHENFGLKIVDVTDTGNPQLLAEIPTGSHSRNVRILGTHAYVSQGHAGMRILDISDPAGPVETCWEHRMKWAIKIILHGDHAFVCQRSYGGPMVFNVGNPAEPDSVCLVETENIKYSYDCVIQGDLIYIAMSSSGLGIADISDLQNPVELSTYDTGDYMRGLDVSGNLACLANDDSLLIMDISDPANPVKTGSVDARSDAYDVAIRDQYAFVADYYEGMTVVNISDPFNPFIAGYLETQRAKQIELKDNFAVIADYGGGVAVLDISDPLNPDLYARYDTPSSSDGADMDERGFIYVIDREDGLYIAQLNPQSGFEPAAGQVNGFQLASNFPNPFNPCTSVRYTVPVRSRVELNVYNIQGQLVACLDQGEKEAGSHLAVWYGTDLRKRPVSAGIYLCRLRSDAFEKTVRMVLLK